MRERERDRVREREREEGEVECKEKIDREKRLDIQGESVRE